MIKELEGKTALVTGGVRGIGRTIAERLASSGALVAVNYAANDEAAADTLASIERAGGQAFAIKTKLGEPGATEALVSRLQAEFLRRTGARGLDILVNNIGGSGTIGSDTIRATDTDAFDYIFTNNVHVPFFLTQALFDHLKDHGRVINISSVASRIAVQDNLAYCMAKSALEMFTRVLAKDLGARGITVNSVGPGYTVTETYTDHFADPANAGPIEDLTLLGRLGQTSDIADFVLALAGPAGRWVTGQNIEASGGFRFR